MIFTASEVIGILHEGDNESTKYNKHKQSTTGDRPGGHSYIETIVHWPADATRRKATAVLCDTTPGAGGKGRFTKSNTTKGTRQMTLQVPRLVSLAQRDGSFEPKAWTQGKGSMLSSALLSDPPWLILVKNEMKAIKVSLTLPQTASYSWLSTPVDRLKPSRVSVPNWWQFARLSA